MKRKPRVYSLWVPHWRPAKKNDLISGHWRTKHRLKRGDRELIAWYSKQQKIPVAIGKRRLDVEIILGPRMRVCDEDAFDLSLRDACVLAGLLVNDNPKWLEPGEVVQRKKYPIEEWGTVLTFTELE